MISLMSLETVISETAAGERGGPWRLPVVTTIREDPRSGFSMTNLLSARITRLWRSGILIRMRTVPCSSNSIELTRPMMMPPKTTGIPSVRLSPVFEERV